MQWVPGFSDGIYHKIVTWYKTYESGRVYSTREKEDIITKEKENIITSRLNKIFFKRSELLFIKDLLDTVDKESVQAQLFRKLYTEFNNKGLKSGFSKLFNLVVKKDEIHAIIVILENLKYKRELTNGLSIKAKPETDEHLYETL